MAMAFVCESLLEIGQETRRCLMYQLRCSGLQEAYRSQLQRSIRGLDSRAGLKVAIQVLLELASSAQNSP
jgi:hypothetical protein